MREEIEKAYDGVLDDLGHRAELIQSENKDWTLEQCVNRAIDDGFYYSDDEAMVLAWAYENGYIQWGKEIEWSIVDDMLKNDIINLIKK